MKTVIVQYEHTVNGPLGSVHFPEKTQDIPCDAPSPEVEEIQEIAAMENFSYEVISFVFTPDTGNNTSRLQFEIELQNQNNYPVQGVPVLTLITDGLETSASYSRYTTSPCYEIGANSTCTLIYDMESSLDIALIEKVELVSVQYVLSN
ncbi:hypothetical protein LZ575_18105 [Antarcticibacterium sp. 1MA-6-2]|uniref:hypothetical protein n=1 Tax=Antarcticibacterium sp. 1MA-6-2 TaxID=2908210 RepID=UPI001F273ED1|nr:hypothetical protein [Antarcticibacterium sp. 1MA-6-2]UJH90664.1 hypothetical protein LZ575_18105 [Antarcticibacterium sp. 1MA-6-2]